MCLGICDTKMMSRWAGMRYIMRPVEVRWLPWLQEDPLQEYRNGSPNSPLPPFIVDVSLQHQASGAPAALPPLPTTPSCADWLFAN